MATFFPSILTVLVASDKRSADRPMFGKGVGTNGAGGPGILHTFGKVAFAISMLPSVTGVFGELTATLIIAGTLPSIVTEVQHNGRSMSALRPGPQDRAIAFRVAPSARGDGQRREERT